LPTFSLIVQSAPEFGAEATFVTHWLSAGLSLLIR
jgi:hypothetical protein